MTDVKNTLNKKRIALAILIITVFFKICPVSIATFGNEISFVVLGDSIAYGYGTNEGESYAAIVADTKGYALSNFAVNGYDSSDVLTQLASDEGLKNAVRSSGIISLSVGGNDFLGADFSAFEDEIRQKAEDGNFSDIIKMLNDIKNGIVDKLKVNFNGIIDNIKLLNPNAILIVQNIYNPVSDAPELIVQTVMNSINDVYSDYLTENKDAFALIDVATAFKGNETFIHTDRIHPSVAGHAKIAQLILERLDSVDKGGPLNPTVSPPNTSAPSQTPSQSQTSATQSQAASTQSPPPQSQSGFFEENSIWILVAAAVIVPFLAVFIIKIGIKRKMESAINTKIGRRK